MKERRKQKMAADEMLCACVLCVTNKVSMKGVHTYILYTPCCTREEIYISVLVVFVLPALAAI
jgi:hypothetical protein